MNEPERGILEIDATRRRQLCAILEFVLDIHVHIDPDRFRIDEPRVRAMRQWLDTGALETTRLSVTSQDLLFLEILIDAADTHSRRREFPALESMDDEDLDQLLAWLGRQTDALFRQPPTIH